MIGLSVLLLGAAAWGLFVLPRSQLDVLDARIAAARSELRRRVELPALRGEGRDCDLREEVAQAGVAFPPVDGWHAADERPWDADAILHPPDDVPNARTDSERHRAAADAMLAAARCRWRADTTGVPDAPHVLQRGAIAALALRRAQPSACLDAAVDLTRLASEASTPELQGELAGFVSDGGSAELALAVGLGCAREAPLADVRRAARELRVLDAAPRSLVDAARAYVLETATFELISVRERSGLPALLGARSIHRTLGALSEWDAVDAMAEPAQLAEIGRRLPTTVGMLPYLARHRVRVRGFVIALEALATAMEASTEGHVAALAVPARVDLHDPFDGAPLRARTSADGALEVLWVAGADRSAAPSVVARVTR